MRFTLTTELDNEVWRGCDVVYALQDSWLRKGNLNLPLEIGATGVLLTRSGEPVGRWEVTETPEEDDRNSFDRLNPADDEGLEPEEERDSKPVVEQYGKSAYIRNPKP
jgi:hypothetical protein